jgi:transposase
MVLAMIPGLPSSLVVIAQLRNAWELGLGPINNLQSPYGFDSSDLEGAFEWTIIFFWLTDEQFARLEPHLPRDTGRKARVDDRRVISGIVHVLKSGCRWIDAPPAYGPRKTLYDRCPPSRDPGGPGTSIRADAPGACWERLWRRRFGGFCRRGRGCLNR